MCFERAEITYSKEPFNPRHLKSKLRLKYRRFSFRDNYRKRSSTTHDADDIYESSSLVLQVHRQCESPGSIDVGSKSPKGK